MGIWHVRTHKATASPVGHSGHRARFGPVLRFLGHLGEMVLAMMLGMALLGALYGAAMGALGYANPRQQFPELSALVMAFNMSVGMVAWMQFRGHGWARSAEMAGAMVVPTVPLVVLAWCSLIDERSLMGAVMNVTTLCMIAIMLYRRAHYAGRMVHHAHAA